MGDMAMSGSFESSLPCRPPFSEPYLRHCEGRASTFQREQSDRAVIQGTQHDTKHLPLDGSGDATKLDSDDDISLKRLEKNSVLRRTSQSEAIGKEQCTQEHLTFLEGE